MTKSIQFLLLMIMLQSFVFGQVKVKGTIIDKKTHLPVEYANIGIFEKGVGTVSSMDGNFEFIIPIELKGNPIIIKHLGYKDATINATQINVNSTSLKIELEPSVCELKAIKISASRETNIGYKPNGEKVKGFFKAAGLGMEGGTLIKNKGPILLTQFNLNIGFPYGSMIVTE